MKTPVSIKIESGSPIPPKPCRRKYHFEQMKVGDSFLHAGKIDHLYLSASRVKAQITVRKVDGGFRVWKIK